jgi:hypothetical protein
MGRLIDEDEALYLLSTSMVPQSMDYTIAMRIARNIIKDTPSALVWNSIEKTPLPLEEVLCCDKYGEVMIGYVGKDSDEYYAESETTIMYNVKYWMALPKVPDKIGQK